MKKRKKNSNETVWIADPVLVFLMIQYPLCLQVFSSISKHLCVWFAVTASEWRVRKSQVIHWLFIAVMLPQDFFWQIFLKAHRGLDSATESLYLWLWMWRWGGFPSFFPFYSMPCSESRVPYSEIESKSKINFTSGGYSGGCWPGWEPNPGKRDQFGVRLVTSLKLDLAPHSLSTFLEMQTKSP